MLFSSNDSLKEELRNAEAEMLKLCRNFGCRQAHEYDIDIVDTAIPRTLVPLKPNKREDNESLTIHGIRVTSKTNDEHSTKTPLVFQHGYMNASCFFYRNLVGLSQQFETIYSLDMLGWGLSSRPVFCLTDDSVETAQDFFVESLEAWRKENNIDKMILAGHSMGGYLSVAYCEKYPQHVERLLLVSPVGVPVETEEIKARRKQNFSLSRRFTFSLYSMLFDNPCSMIGTLPRYKGRQYMMSYVKNRLLAIDDPKEQAAFANYLFLNCILPISGAQCLNYILNAFAYAKKPLLHRIPLLKVSNVSFLYGSNDWMDSNAGLDAFRLCQQQQGATTIRVYKVPDAGHLLMLDNWQDFNTTLIAAAACQGSSTFSESSGEQHRFEELTSKLGDNCQDSQQEAFESAAQPAPRVMYT